MTLKYVTQLSLLLINFLYKFFQKFFDCERYKQLRNQNKLTTQRLIVCTHAHGCFIRSMSSSIVGHRTLPHSPLTLYYHTHRKVRIIIMSLSNITMYKLMFNQYANKN